MNKKLLFLAVMLFLAAFGIVHTFPEGLIFIAGNIMGILSVFFSLEALFGKELKKLVEKLKKNQ